MKVVVVGLGYVGLPLLCSLQAYVSKQSQAKYMEHMKVTKVLGFDTDLQRVQEINSGVDSTNCVSSDYLKGVRATSCIDDCHNYDVFIICVPTPLFGDKPDLRYLDTAVKSISTVLRNGCVVINESTVYIGCTRERVGKALRELRPEIKFSVAYSPERISPTANCTFFPRQLTKLISGEDNFAVKTCRAVYGGITANAIKPWPYTDLFEASSMEAAEASKLLENTQRCVNIALMNECSSVFRRHGLDTSEVIELASTKWNFNYYEPGLVGGHCVPVDPYYLLRSSDYNVMPIVRISLEQNRKLVDYIVYSIQKMLNQKGISAPSIGVLGLSYKPNIGDIRESGSIRLIAALYSRIVGCEVYVEDQLVTQTTELGATQVECLTDNKYDVFIYSVWHDYTNRLFMNEEMARHTLTSMAKDDKLSNLIVVDLPGLINKAYPKLCREMLYWTL